MNTNSEDLSQKDKVEQIETGQIELSREKVIASQFRELFNRPSFVNGYLDRRTAPEAKILRDIDERISFVTERKIGLIVDALACKKLGVTSVEEGRKRGKEWGRALGEAKKDMKANGVEIEVEGVTGTLPHDKWVEILKAEAAKDFSVEREAATKTLEDARTQYSQSLKETGLDFLKNMVDPDFQKILDHWGDAPSLDGSIQHAGLVHFIEYRSDTSKDRLSHVPEAFSSQGFTEYTKRLMELVRHPDSEEIAQALRLRDDGGRERLLIMTKDKQYISAFKYQTDNTWRIITHIPGMLDKQWEKTKVTMTDVTAQAKYHNRLEGEIVQLPLSSD